MRGLGDRGLMDSSVVTMMHAVRGYFRFAHIDGLIPADPAVYGRLPKIHHDESRTQGLDRLELIRFLQVAQTISVHHGALAYLLGINALRASEAATVRTGHYADTLRGYRGAAPGRQGHGGEVADGCFSDWSLPMYRAPVTATPVARDPRHARRTGAAYQRPAPSAQAHRVSPPSGRGRRRPAPRRPRCAHARPPSVRK